MNKSVFIDFISKYNVAKSEAVSWKANDNKLTTRFISGDKSMIGEVTILNFDLPDINDVEIGIHGTTKLLKLFDVLNDEINVTLNKINDKPVSLKLSDNKSKINYALSDLAVIPVVPQFKYIPSQFQIAIKINPDFIYTFLKAKSALPDVDTFAINSTKKGCKIIIGQTDINSNTITFNVDTEYTDDIDEKHFNSDIFYNILSANKALSATFLISKEGLGVIEFDTENYNAKYYLVAKKGA